MTRYYAAVDGELYSRNIRNIPLMEDAWVCIMKDHTTPRIVVSFHRSRALAEHNQKLYKNFWDSSYIKPATTDKLAAVHEQLRQNLEHRASSSTGRAQHF